MEIIWKLSIHERLKMHQWRIASNLLPSKAAISTFTPTLDTICCLCENSPETITHLLWECSLARALWFSSKWCIRTDLIPVASPLHLVELLVSLPESLGLTNLDSEQFILWGALLFYLLWRV